MSKNLLTKLSSVLVLSSVLASAPILSACNSNNENIEEPYIENENVKSINSYLKEDTDLDLTITGLRVENQNNTNLLRIYASEYFPPLYSYKIEENNVTPIKIQDEFYKYYTVTYKLDNVHTNSIPFVIGSYYDIKNVNTAELNFINHNVDTLTPKTIIEDGSIIGDITYGD